MSWPRKLSCHTRLHACLRALLLTFFSLSIFTVLSTTLFDHRLVGGPFTTGIIVEMKTDTVKTSTNGTPAAAEAGKCLMIDSAPNIRSVQLWAG
jgi:hypothetical protein